MIAKQEIDDDVLTLENLGGIEHIDIPCRPATVVVLRGRNGAGKSTVLQAVDAVVNKRPLKATKREGAASTDKAFARGFGVTIKLGLSGPRRSNDLVVEAIEDDFDLGTLVDPGIADPQKADLRRIKALCNIVDAEVSLEDLYALVGSRETFEAIVRKESLEIADPITMVEAVKRDFEAAARAKNSAAEQAHAAAVAKLAENDGVDLTAPSDSLALQQTLTDAVQRLSQLTSDRDAWARMNAGRMEARQQLDAVSATYDGPTVEQAEGRVTALNDALLEKNKLVAEMERRLMDLSTEIRGLQVERKAAEAAASAAKSHEQALAGWRRTISEAGAETCPVQPADIEQAAAAVTEARKATEYGQRVRDALKRKDEAAQREQEAEKCRLLSEKFRTAAQGTLDVLAESVRAVSERIDFDSEFRLVVKHPTRKTCYFADLSVGERLALALDMVIETAKRSETRKVAKIDQEAWEALDGCNREMVVGKVRGSNITVITAEATREADPNAALSYEVLA